MESKEQVKQNIANVLANNLKIAGYIYIVVNKYIPSLVKVGFAKDLDQRLYQYNHNTEAPAAFEYYATFETYLPVGDKELFDQIDILDSSLRQSSKQEWYKISPEAMFNIIQTIADGNPLYKNGTLCMTEDDLESDKTEVENTTKKNSDKKYYNSDLIDPLFEKLGLPTGAEKLAMNSWNDVYLKDTKDPKYRITSIKGFENRKYNARISGKVSGNTLTFYLGGYNNGTLSILDNNVKDDMIELARKYNLNNYSAKSTCSIKIGLEKTVKDINNLTEQDIKDLKEMFAKVYAAAKGE